MDKFQVYVDQLFDDLKNGKLTNEDYLQNLINELNKRSNDKTFTQEDIETRIKCPLCKKDFNGIKGFYLHSTRSVYEDHKKFYKDNKSKFKELYKIYNNILIELGKSTNIPPNPKNEENPKELEKPKEYKIIGGKGMEEKKNITILDAYDKLEELLTAVLGPQNENKINGIMYLFKDQKDYENLDKLEQILKQFRVPQATIDTIIDDYSAYIGVEKEPENVEGKKGSGKGDQIEEIKTLFDQRLEDIKEKIKNDIQLQELIQKAKSFGLDLSKYGIPNLNDEKDETVPWENPYTHEIIEVPKSKYPQYMAITQRYEETHKNKAEQDETVPWENPYTHEIIEVPKSKLPQYLAITQRYEEISKAKKSENEERVPWEDPVTKKIIEVPIDKLHYYMNISASHAKTEEQREFETRLEQLRRENIEKLNELKKTYEEIINENKKKLEELSQALQEKDKEKLYSYIGSLQDKIEKLEKKDDLQEITQKYEDIRKLLTRLGYAPQEQTVKDQAELKKIDVQAEAITKGIDVLVDQAKQFGVPFRNLVNSLSPLVQEEARRILQQRNQKNQATIAGQEIPYNEQELIELEKRLDATGKIQEQGTKQNIPIQEEVKKEEPKKEEIKSDQKFKSKNIIIASEKKEEKKE
ncbi:MAG: hypothetical protein QW745_08295 [Thermoplasmata archaeon]